MLTIRLFSFLFVLASITACNKETSPNGNPVSPATVAKTAEMNQALAWKIFNAEQKNRPDENILISPFSIQTALFMATNGAKGNTQNEILALMAADGESPEALNPAMKDLTILLAEQSGHPEVTIANGYFYDPQRMTVKTPFLDILENSYACEAEQENFNNDNAALNTINTWVKNNTKGKIDKILDKITADDVAFLINALHFKADWATGFSPQLTQEAPFTHIDGSSVTAHYVFADRNFAFAQTPQYQLVDIPFKDSTFSFSLIQATAGNTNPDWSLGFDPETWKGLYTGIQYSRAMVWFPRLKLAYDGDIINSLKQLGVNDAFSESAADFTAMGTGSIGNIFISQIRHKAVLEVDEKGAEGAAVTSIGFSQTSLPPVFRFDHPFILVLRHIPTNTIVFIGKVNTTDW